VSIVFGKIFSFFFLIALQVFAIVHFVSLSRYRKPAPAVKLQL